jgi:DNA relaxase NicK
MSATPKTTVDYLTFRTQGEVKETAEAIAPLFGGMAQDLNLNPLQRGMQGFEQASEIRLADLRIGRMDYGGNSQRGWLRVTLTGQGCEWVNDWDEAERVLSELPRAEPKRLDLALTTWDGEVTHERVVAAHAVGGFCSGGRPPALQQIISSDPRAGRTCYVGKRESDKFGRAYEKGLELVGKMGVGGREVTHIDGHAVEDIYRFEVELKAKTRPIPWEVIGGRDQYFAGSYPFLAELLPEVECDILMRRPERAPQTDLRAALDTVRHQFGATLFTALCAMDGDILAVWDRIVGYKHNEELLAAGVLLVDHG